MSDSNKIPFGLRDSDNALVDVFDVRTANKVVASAHHAIPIWKRDKAI